MAAGIRRRIGCGALFSVILVSVPPAVHAADAPPPPVAIKQTERVSVRLVQIDAIVREKEPLGRALTAADFELTVGGHPVTGFLFDRACGGTSNAAAASQEPGAAPGEPPPPTPVLHPTIVFFFDQTHLTQGGRDRAIETAESLVDRLIVNGAKGAVVSSGRELVTVVAPTEDRAHLKAGLGAMRNDGRAIETYAVTEEFRIAGLYALMKAGFTTTAQAMARDYAREEYQEVRRTKARIGIVMDGLVEAAPPKGVVYFGDTLRQLAGLHYLLVTGAEGDATTQGAYAEIDAIIASALGASAHLFTVEAQGLQSSDAIRIRHAQDTLVTLALETGGAAFLRNTPAELMAKRIEERVGCPYIVSFPPGDLPKDQPLPVSLKALVPGVKVDIQGRVVIASESAILSARLLSAFASPRLDQGRSVRLALIPRGATGRTWQASLQIRVLPELAPAAGIDLGASVIQDERVVDAVSNTIASGGPVRPLVLEHALSLAPGPVRIVGVAYDRAADDVVSTSMEGEWPDPGKGAAVIAPIAVVQMRDAAVSKDGEAHSGLSTAIDPDEAIDPGSGVALQSVVCRGPKAKGPLTIDRRVEGTAKGEFAPMTLAPDDAACLEIVDVLRAGTAPGALADYRVVVRGGDEIVAEQRRSLRFGGK